MPRPALALLGLKYRRIPILAIGRDVYLDTRLILPKLERLVASCSSASAGPSPGAGAGTGPPLSAPAGTATLALERLLSLWTTSTPLFARAQQLLPGADLPLLRDPAFQRDRADFVGPAALASADETAALRAEAMGEIRDAVELLETTLLADGREWVLSGDSGPTMADIEAVWLVHWITGLPGAVDSRVISRDEFPRVYAWIERFQGRVAQAKQQQQGRGQVTSVTGDAARDAILAAAFAEDEIGVDADEPLVRHYGLAKGQTVRVWPTDSGSGAAHIDEGKLVGISAKEVVFETAIGVRVHAPRLGFRVRPVCASATTPPSNL